MIKRIWITMVLASSLAAGGVRHAGAEPAPASKNVRGPSTRRLADFYGLQILSCDMASLIAGVAVNRIFPGGDMPGKLVFTGGYLVGGPLVHLHHGHRWRAATSVALRVGLPALGFSLARRGDSGCGTAEGCDDVTNIVSGVFLVLGMGVASLADSIILGTVTERVPAKPRPGPGPTIVPQVSAGADGSLHLGVLGRF